MVIKSLFTTFQWIRNVTYVNEIYVKFIFKQWGLFSRKQKHNPTSAHVCGAEQAARLNNYVVTRVITKFNNDSFSGLLQEAIYLYIRQQPSKSEIRRYHWCYIVIKITEPQVL